MCRLKDKGVAIKHIDDCKGSIKARSDAVSDAFVRRETAKRAQKSEDSTLRMQAGRDRLTKKKPGRPVTNPNAAKSKHRVRDPTRPDLGGRYPRNQSDAPVSMGAAVPILARYLEPDHGEQPTLDAATSVFVHPLPSSKTLGQIEANLGQECYRGYGLVELETLLASTTPGASAVAPPRHDIAPPTRRQLVDGDVRLLWSYVVMPGDTGLEYGFVVSDDRELNAKGAFPEGGAIDVRLLGRVPDEEYMPFTGTLPFEGVEFDPAPMAWMMTDCLRRVIDDPGNLLDCGPLFAFDASTSLFHGIVNLDDMEDVVDAAAAAGEAAALQAHALRAPVDMQDVASDEVAKLRRKIFDMRHQGVDRPKMVELRLLCNGAHWTPPRCSVGPPDGPGVDPRDGPQCIFNKQQFSRKGYGQSEFKLIDPRGALPFRVVKYYCATHNRWESAIGPHCATYLGDGGVSLSTDVVFPGGSRIGLTASGFDYVDQQFQINGNARAVRRAVMTSWIDQLKGELSALVRSLRPEERDMLKKLLPQLRAELLSDLPHSDFFETAFLAKHAAVRKPLIARLIDGVAVLAGGRVGLDFGHTASNCVTTRSQPAGRTYGPDPPPAPDPAEQSWGERRSADVKATTRVVASTTFVTYTAVAIGEGASSPRGPITFTEFTTVSVSLSCCFAQFTVAFVYFDAQRHCKFRFLAW
jgi:hypothetical protein